MRPITWPIAAIAIAGIAAAAAMFWMSDSQARSALLGLLLAVVSGCGAIYTRDGARTGTEELKALVRSELRPVAGRVRELLAMHREGGGHP